MPPRKRSAAEQSPLSRRRSGRLSTNSVKSSYFEGTDNESDEAVSRPTKRQKVKPGNRIVVNKDESDDEGDVYNDNESEDEFVDENENGEEHEEDEDEDSEEDESKPMKVTIVPLEEMRDTGGVAYEDYKLHKNSMLFLKDLKAHNQRSWLKSHDGEYRRALKDWATFVDATSTTIMEVDETIPELPAKDLMFRIHRDVRFSKDPTPYKPHFSAAWSRTGRKGPYACYYIHCEPGKAFIGGGLWHPEAQFVQKLRRSIDRHPQRWREAMGDTRLRSVFFPNIKANAGVEAIVKGFVAKNQDNALKKKPMNYDATHRDIELLKLKNYTLGAKIDENVLCKEDAQETVRNAMSGLVNFVTFLNNIVMPDPNLESDSSSEDEDEDEDEDDAV